MKVYKIHEMAEKLGVSIKTLQRWDDTGQLRAKRTLGNHRYYTEDQYRDYLGISDDEPHRKVVAYVRVSSRGQRGELAQQIDCINTFTNASGIILDECIEDIGSGLNYNRPKWNELLQSVMNDEIQTIYITHKDRFVRFGFEWFEQLCRQHLTEIVVLNRVETNPTQELVEDIATIIQMFHGQAPELLKYKITLEDEEVVHETQSTSETLPE